jgi:hypothetical protein
MREAQTRYGSKPDFPKDEAGLKALSEHLDQLVPKEAQTQSVGKQIYLFLLKLLYGTSPAGFILDEDDFRVAPLMKNYFNAIQKGKLRGEEANLNNYRNLEELENALEKDNSSSQDDENEQDMFTEQEWKTIQAGAQLVYNSGGWKLWRVAKGSGNVGASAALLLCENRRHGVGWCVGRDTSYGKRYIGDGDFFVFSKNDRSRYAVSSESKYHALTIWNPADTPIFSIGGVDQQNTLPKSVQEAEKKAGVQLNSAIPSSIPAEIIPIIQTVRSQQPVFQYIPESKLRQLNNDEQQALLKVLHYVDPSAFAKDLNEMYKNATQVVNAHSLLSYALSPKVGMVFSEDDYKNMSEHCMLGFIEAFATTGEKRLPETLDNYLLAEVNQWINGFAGKPKY